MTGTRHLRGYLQKFSPLLGFALVGAALWVLHRLFAQHTLTDLTGKIRALSSGQLVIAASLTAVSYIVLTGYDLLGLRYIDQNVPRGRAMLTSFLGYSFANNLGFLGGVGMRLRFYSSLGLRSFDIAKIVAFTSVTFWLGFIGLGGVLFAIAPPRMPAGFEITTNLVRMAGWALLATIFVYLCLGLARIDRFRLGRWVFRMPGVRVRLGQVFVSACDWALAASVLYALLPGRSGLPFITFLSVYLVAQIAAFVSGVPGGVGVLESLLVLLLPISVEREGLLASLVVFRLIYYIAPLVIATVTTGAIEASRFSPFQSGNRK